MIFKTMASRLKAVNDKINNVSETIIRDLACRIFFDGLLHPIPASTILKYTTGSSQTDIDDSTEACWVNTAVKPSITFYFSPVESKTLFPLEAVVALAKNSDGSHILWTDPQWPGKNHVLSNFDVSNENADIDSNDCIYIGLKLFSDDNEVPAADLFIHSSPELLGLIRWGRWSFTQAEDVFSKPDFYGKASLKNISRKKPAPEISLWGHNYFPQEHKDEYSDFIFNIPGGKISNPPFALRQTFSGQSRNFWEDIEPLYWIKIEFDRKVPSNVLKSFVLTATNCLVAVNSHFQKQNFFYHGPGPMTLDLQSPANEIYDIISISDNRGRLYSNVYGSAAADNPECRYIPRVHGDFLQLMIIPPPEGPPPDRFSVEYKTSADQLANGIVAGNISSLYNPHPGIESVINLTDTRGGVEARTFDDMIAAFPHVLKSHNRAISFSDFESLALVFDKRIKSAKAKLSSTSRNGIILRCLELEVNLGGYKFEPPEEGQLFLARLQNYLETRSPMGTVVKAIFS